MRGVGQGAPASRRWRHSLGSILLCILWLGPALLGACGGRQPGGLPPDSDSGDPALAAVQGGTLKIITLSSGMVRVALSALKSAGFPAAAFDAGRFRLTHRGQAQPVWVARQPEPESFIFYAAPPDSLYTQENVYLLEWGDVSGLAMPDAPRPAPVKQEAELVAQAVLHQEENNHYAPQVEAGERWLWQSLPAPQEAAFSFLLHNTAAGPGELTLEVWASTEAPESPDHHLRLLVNQRLVLDETWDGRGRRELAAAVPAGLLVEGENRLVVQAVGDTAAPADIVFIDWFEVRYLRYLTALDGRLEFNSQGAPQILRGLAETAQVFDITEQGKTLEASRGFEITGEELRFTGLPGHRYLAVDRSGFLDPERIEAAVLEPDLAEPGNGADYVAIGPPDLLEPLRPVLEWREGQGLKTVAVPVEAIYDQFGAGLPEPEALRSFLQYAAQNWQPAPRYVLLVGDATYDPREYQSAPEANRLPALFVITDYGGETASDVLLALLDEDAWPDLAVGRVPARQPAQVRVFVEKTLAYERDSQPGGWRKRILAVADGQEPAFQGDARHFLDQFPDDFDRQLYSPAAGAADAPEQITQFLQDGALWVAYFGHGSVALWGKDRLFSVEEVKGLDNLSRLPVVVQMTCLTGLFTHPKVESLSERLLFAEQGGAVGLLAPTSLTLPLDQGFLSDALAQAYLAEPAGRLGDLLLAAQRQVPVEDRGTREVLLTYLWFGDPALRLVGELTQ